MKVMAQIPEPRGMRKTAVVLNDFLSTRGGGERSSLEYAAALADLGFETTIACCRPFADSLEEIAGLFGIEPRNSWRLAVYESEGDFIEANRKNPPSVFVNHTYGSNMPPVGEFNIFAVMFPHGLRNDGTDEVLRYDVQACISDFTALYARVRWGDSAPVQVLYAPLSEIHCRNNVRSLKAKQKLILQIGRFNALGHCKNQLLAIQAFKRAIDEGALDRAWRFRIIGQVNDSEGTAEYVEACREAMSGYPVELILGASVEEIVDSYCEATALVQCTGQELAWGISPEKCEHLGLVALDCFAYGTIPIVYRRSGAGMLINHGSDGFVYGDEDQLVSILGSVSESFGTVRHCFIYENCLKRVNDLSFMAFRGMLGEMIEGGWAR